VRKQPEYLMMQIVRFQRRIAAKRIVLAVRSFLDRKKENFRREQEHAARVIQVRRRDDSHLTDHCTVTGFGKAI
jgi:hypothetical protein